MAARDACVEAAHQQFPDLVFHAHDPRQLQSNEDLWALQVTDIPFFLTKNNIPKRWAYITFPSQELMDAAMEQLIRYQGHTLQWNLPDDTNKLCHRCGKLGCAPNQCPLRQQRGRTRDQYPVAALKERFHVGQSSRPKANSRSRSRSRSRSKGPDISQSSQHQHSSSVKPKTTIPNNHRSRSKSNDKRDRSVSFASALRTPPSSSARSQPPSLFPQEASEILSLLKALQQDMADVRERITALELNDQRMTRIERHIGLHPLHSVSPSITQPSNMVIDHPDVPNPSLAKNSLNGTPPSRPLNPLLPDFVSSTPPVVPACNPSSAINTSASTIPSPQQASAEIQAINEKHSAIEIYPLFPPTPLIYFHLILMVLKRTLKTKLNN
ncbi:hypothetical protein GLOIN_2v1766278 [Rhizophagus clarus]|uniref:Uncharacterized protein n=1 Tax=Rhizophagus clarus TaxID=94130 RepID=A0A8H3LV08_9GLOM|nr:hypothetical protein GLOIN_2v1766278 [Rhizophagus clarus]